MVVRSWAELDLDDICAHARVFGFDLDNTLASSKQPMEPAMIARFSALTAHATVALISGGGMAVVSLLLFIWPVVFGALTTFGELIMSLGPIGAGIYGFLNRLLIPTGLHHALNNVFWFNIAGIDDIARYWQGAAYQGDPVSIAGYHPGMYQAGFFPIQRF